MRSCRGAREAGVRGIKPWKCFPTNSGLFSGSPERPAACLSGLGQETAFSCSGPTRSCRTAEGGGARTRAAYPGEGARRLPGEPLCRPWCSSPSLDLNFPRGEPSSQQGNTPRPPTPPGPGSSPKGQTVDLPSQPFGARTPALRIIALRGIALNARGSIAIRIRRLSHCRGSSRSPVSGYR